MALDTALARGRAAALARMTDACTVRRRTGETEGPGGVITPTWADVYTGQCRVQVRSDVSPGSSSDVAEAALIIKTHEVHLPLSAVGILEGDEIEITAARYDPDLVGRVYRVRTVLTKSAATARRVSAIEVTS